jgi:hypothetical protein
METVLSLVAGQLGLTTQWPLGSHEARKTLPSRGHTQCTLVAINRLGDRRVVSDRATLPSIPHAVIFELPRQKSSARGSYPQSGQSVAIPTTRTSLYSSSYLAIYGQRGTYKIAIGRDHKKYMALLL